MNNADLYAKTSPSKLFFLIAIPGAISMIASSLWGLFDGIFVGNLLGEAAFAALNLAFPFVLINFSLADLVGVGSAINISILLGKENNKEADNYFTCACIMILISSSLAGIILYFFSPALMRLMGADENLAALAVSAGMFICTLIALYPFARGKLALHFCIPRFSLKMIRQIIAGGSPNFLSNVASRLTAILMNVVLLNIGGSIAVSAYGVLMYIGDTIQQLLYGTCDGMQPAIGYNWGACSLDRVKALFKCCITACAVISIGGTVLMYAVPDAIVSLFVQAGEKELLTMSARALQIYGLTYLTRWFGFAVQSLLVTLERPLPATILSVANALFIPIILLPILWPLKLNGLWLNTPVTSLLVSILALIFYLRAKKHTLLSVNS